MDLESPSPKPSEAAGAPGEAASPAAAAEPARAPLPIVGIGASAGGLEPLEALVARLAPANLAVVVVQHLAAGREGVLVDLLRPRTTLDVSAAVDGTVVLPGHLYVAPAGVDLALEGGRLRVAPRSDEAAVRHPIDAFLRSLAVERGRLAIGVVLSGSGTDGTLGLEAIRQHDGVTLVQDPATAVHRSMPESAIDTGSGDACLAPAAIGDELMRLAGHPYVTAAEEALGLPEAGLAGIFALLRKAYGVDFSRYKRGTIVRRVERRMLLNQLDEVGGYVAYLESNPQETVALYGDLLIGVTSFFRDAEPFEALRTLVLPRLLDARPHDVPIRIWVAGASTGEEPYSVAMSLFEYLGDQVLDRKIQIFATDVDDAALARARHAIYPPSIELDVSPERLQRFFAKVERGYQVSRPIRDAVVFAHHDLSRDPPFSRLDLVCCRNVLIYMQPSSTGPRAPAARAARAWASASASRRASSRRTAGASRARASRVRRRRSASRSRGSAPPRGLGSRPSRVRQGRADVAARGCEGWWMGVLTGRDPHRTEGLLAVPLTAPSPAAQVRVLVVDDHADVRETLCELLALDGFAVEAVDGGAAALERLADAGAAGLPDVIVLDYSMPGMTGGELLERLEGDPALANIPVLMLTADVESARATASQFGCAWLAKPSAAMLLPTAVARLAAAARGLVTGSFRRSG